MSVGKQVVSAFILLGLGWTIGHAQRPEPDFMIAIDAPVGDTRVECTSGCTLMGAKDLGNPNAMQMRVYTYGCSGRSVQRCGTQVAGWRVQ